MSKEQPTTLTHLTTEARNPASTEIDSLSAIEIVQLISEQDAGIAAAVAGEARSIAAAIDVIAERFRSGGRLLYLGAGTSGRLGVLDASECPPTFSTPPEMVVGLIAGGNEALTRAIEGAEDHPESGAGDLVKAGLSEKDVVVGIATSGRTPYVIGGLQYAKQTGAFTVGFSCNEECGLRPHCQIMITPIVGAEVISGSTRMKAGTATKMVLNMLTTGAMVRIGKTYGNLMVDLKATNEKLARRSCRIVSDIAGVDPAEAAALLQQCEGEVKTAIVSHLRGVSPETARKFLSDAGGHLRSALGGGPS
jgi:N-acetylmuramic acid 6-phosphate etherase